MLLQPWIRLVIVTQHVNEVKGIYAVLFMGDKDCVGVHQEASSTNQWPSWRYFLEDTPEAVMLSFNPFTKGCEIASQW
jgi:hypothetical protein